METILYLSSCDSCKRILAELQPPKHITLQDIKSHPVTAGQLIELRRLAGSYESLFNKRARLLRERGLHEKNLTEADYASLLTEHYTFLKRPVIVVDDKIFIGNNKKTVAAAREHLHP